MPQKIVAIDSQRLESMASCARIFDNKFNKNLVPLITPDYLERGSLIHEMLAVYYNLRMHRENWKSNGKTYRDICESCIKAGRFKGHSMSLAISEIEYTIDIFNQYTDLWENDGWDNIEAVEKSGSKILYTSDNLIILYEVKIDLILKEKNKLRGVDHKHSQSRRDPNELSNQFKGYCWFLETDEFIVNEVGFQKTVKPVDKFRRHPLLYSKEIIDEWRESVIYYVNLALEWERMGIYPPNYTSCDKFSGCDFKDICKAVPGEYRQFMLNKNFKERTWDVGKEHL